jgi:hypothetical protein
MFFAAAVAIRIEEKTFVYVLELLSADNGIKSLGKRSCCCLLLLAMRAQREKREKKICLCKSEREFWVSERNYDSFFVVR